LFDVDQVKSILDIEKTLEYLETQGVCVATLGPERHFPAFFTAASGFQSPYHVRTGGVTEFFFYRVLVSLMVMATVCPHSRISLHHRNWSFPAIGRRSIDFPSDVDKSFDGEDVDFIRSKRRLK